MVPFLFKPLTPPPYLLSPISYLLSPISYLSPIPSPTSVEFTEHVGRNFQPNYLPSFHQAALVFVSHSHWGGWVRIHDTKY